MSDQNTNYENDYLGITEAADYLRVSASTLRRWEKKGFLVPERTPTGIRRYTRLQLDEVMQTPPPAHQLPKVASETVITPRIETAIIPVEPLSASAIVLTGEVTLPEELSSEKAIPLESDQSINEVDDIKIDIENDSLTKREVALEETIKAKIEGHEKPIEKEHANLEIINEDSSTPISSIIQDDFEKMFNIDNSMPLDKDDIDELNEYDNDAALSNGSEVRSYNSFSQNEYQHKDNQDKQIQNRKSNKLNPLLLLAGILVSFLVLGTLVWYVLLMNSNPQQLINPVAQ
ncbi:MAG: helix-turn-helix domain-containing protein [bacterium]|nr:helix-turn-helix domain-containing protein [bacterium]